MKRYEQTIRVVTAFYAVLLGFGLKNLVDGKFIAESHWLLFGVASLFFLRFLSGSANHLWVEYVSQEPQKVSAAAFLFDMTLLIVFGGIALTICYAATIEAFLTRNFWLAVIATGGGVVYWLRQAKGKPGWSFWVWINLTQAVLTYAARYARREYALPKLPWWEVDAILAGLAAAYFILLLLDIRKQLEVLATVQAPPKA